MKIKFSRKILVFILVFVLGTGAGVGGLTLKEKIFPNPNGKTQSVEKKSDEVGPVVQLKEFLVNLDGGGMLKTEIAVEGVNAKSEEEIKNKEIFLRDRIIAVLSAKKMSDVRTTQGRDNLKKELVTGLNEVCQDKIKDVLFTSFVYSP
jgi:flagellar FliL protein